MLPKANNACPTMKNKKNEPAGSNKVRAQWILTHKRKESNMSSMQLDNLDARTRDFMRREFDVDVADGTLYISPRLSHNGRSIYPNLLRDAIETGSPDSLAASLDHPRRFIEHEDRWTQEGGATIADVPSTAAVTLADGEFNRFYIAFVPEPMTVSLLLFGGVVCVRRRR